MWYPEYLGNEGNVLLKLIEEPTTNTILLFVAHNLEKVLLTIQSRTQLFMLERLQETEIQKALIEQQVNPEEALQIARLADGNYFQAQQLLITHDDDLILLLRTWLNCLYANKGIELVNWITEISEKSKDTQKKFLQYYMQLLEEAIRAQHIGIQHLTLLETEQKIIEILLAKGVNYTLVNTICSMIDESIYQIERNANTKILFHSLSLRIQQLIFKQKAIA
jgi:DNA polymerase-3 subunit delta'